MTIILTPHVAGDNLTESCEGDDMDERTIAGVCGAMNHLTEVLRRKADVFKAEAEGPIAELRANDFLYLAEAFEAQVRDLHRAAGFDENGGAK